MNSKMTTISQLSTTESKKTKIKTKQTTRTGTESQKWRSQGGLSAGTGWKGEVNNMGNGDAKELVCMTRGMLVR